MSPQRPVDEAEKTRLSLLEDKLTDSLALLLQLRNKVLTQTHSCVWLFSSFSYRSTVPSSVGAFSSFPLAFFKVSVYLGVIDEIWAPLVVLSLSWRGHICSVLKLCSLDARGYLNIIVVKTTNHMSGSCTMQAPYKHFSGLTPIKLQQTLLLLLKASMSWPLWLLTSAKCFERLSKKFRNLL